MGCAPSIHVSHSGVVYCRDSDESNSPRPSSLSVQQHHQYGGLIIRATTDITEAGTSAAPISQFPGGRKERRGTISIEAETQTGISSDDMKGEVNDLILGPMKVTSPPIQVMLVFAKEDAQSDGFWWAADKGGYRCNIVRNPTAALECFLEKQHDIVIIDYRHAKTFDSDSLCRSLRATKVGEHTVIVAVTKKSNSEKEEPSILPLLNIGFNRCYIENPNTGSCLNELIQLERTEVKMQNKIRLMNTLFAALEKSSDSVEITSCGHHVEYVNPAYEHMTGYTIEEVLGKDSNDLDQTDKNKPELMDTVYSQLKKNKAWEGSYYGRRKNGETFKQSVHIIPVIGHGGKVRHHVFIKRRTDYENDTVMPLEKFKDAPDYQNGGLQNRRQSMARIHAHAMTIEAPITKVINMINAAQENSPINVAQALDHVLDILRSSELYSPHPQVVKEEDQMTSELVGGLMMGVHSKRRHSGSGSEITVSKGGTHFYLQGNSYAKEIPPAIKEYLDYDDSWDFDVIGLEKVTSKRPLTYLGMKIMFRFNVCEFLGCSEQTLYNWLQVIESNYHSSNPYHNSSHAADVLHATAYFLNRDRLKNVLDHLDEVSSLIAAAVHDIDHPGRTNTFLVNSGSELAILYNDTAVLESHHAAIAFKLTTKDPKSDIFRNLDRDDYRTLRQCIIDLVLATEMGRHFEHLSKFVTSIKPPKERENDDKTSQQSIGNNSSDVSTSLSLTSSENRNLIKRILIKCADISNPARPLDLCKEWAARISEEYFSQTDEEKERGLPIIMPIFDRNTCSVPKSQISFIDFFVKDMFEAWDSFVECPEIMQNLQSNYKHWKELEERQNSEKKTKE